MSSNRIRWSCIGCLSIRRQVTWASPRLPGRRQHPLQALPKGVVVLAEQALAFEQGLEPLGELALKNPRQLNDQLFELGQLLLALGQLPAGGHQGRARGGIRAQGAGVPWRRLVRGGWRLQGTGATGTVPIFARPGADWGQPVAHGLARGPWVRPGPTA